MLKSLIQRKAFENWKSVLLIYLFCLIVCFSSVYFHSTIMTIISVLLYAVITFLFVKKVYWKEIRIQKPNNLKYILMCLPILIFLILFFYYIQYIALKFDESNFFVALANQQLKYGVINNENKWLYFPLTVIGFSIIPLSEDLFFRGLILTAFENISKRKNHAANIIQAVLFALVHIAYFWTIKINYLLIIPLFIWVLLAGIIYGWLTQKTNSIISSMIAHGINDVITMIIVYLLVIPYLK